MEVRKKKKGGRETKEGGRGKEENRGGVGGNTDSEIWIDKKRKRKICRCVEKSVKKVER